MKEYEFTLRFDPQDPDVDLNDYIEQLHECGCSDALVSMRENEYIAVNFIREASSFYMAIFTAVSDMRRCIPRIIPIEVHRYASIDILSIRLSRR